MKLSLFHAVFLISTFFAFLQMQATPLQELLRLEQETLDKRHQINVQRGDINEQIRHIMPAVHEFESGIQYDFVKYVFITLGIQFCVGMYAIIKEARQTSDKDEKDE